MNFQEENTTNTGWTTVQPNRKKTNKSSPNSESSRTTSAGAKKRTASKPRNCYTCNGAGHFARDCPTKKKEYGARKRTVRKPTICYNCNRDGHFARDCPTQKKGNDATSVMTSENFPELSPRNGSCHSEKDLKVWRNDSKNWGQTKECESNVFSYKELVGKKMTLLAFHTLTSTNVTTSKNRRHPVTNRKHHAVTSTNVTTSKNDRTWTKAGGNKRNGRQIASNKRQNATNGRQNAPNRKKKLLCKCYVGVAWLPFEAYPCSKTCGRCGFAHGVEKQNPSDISERINSAIDQANNGNTRSLASLKLTGTPRSEDYLKELSRRSKVCRRFLSCKQKLKNNKLELSDICVGGINCLGGCCGDKPDFDISTQLLDEGDWKYGIPSGKGIQLTKLGLVPLVEQERLVAQVQKDAEQQEAVDTLFDEEQSPGLSSNTVSAKECKWKSKEWEDVAEELEEVEEGYLPERTIREQIEVKGELLWFTYHKDENETFKMLGGEPHLTKPITISLPGAKLFSMRLLTSDKQKDSDAFWAKRMPVATVNNSHQQQYDEYLEEEYGDYLEEQYSESMDSSDDEEW